MFKKKPTVKLLASLRSTDRRKLANQLVETFSPTPSSNDTDVTLRNRILPPNARSAKLSTTSGPDLKPVSGTLYVGGEPPSQPLWVQIGDEGPFPTVYTLWRNAGLLPILLTHDDVLARMRDGADLMVPGLIGPPFPDGAKAGRLVGIASEHNPSVPLVVGVCEVDVCDIVGVAGGHGRAVRGVHWVGDEIFKMGDGEVPDVVVAEQEVVEAEAEAEAGDGDGGGVALNDAGAALDEDEEREKKDDFRELSTREIDETFHSAAIFGIHDFHSTGKFSSLALPLTSSQFISTLVLPYLPPASSFAPHNLLQNTVPHPSLQLKKSSHKSAAKFLKSLDKELLVKIKNRNGGEVIVIDINWESDVVAAFEPYPLPEAPKEKKGPASEGPQGSSGILKVVELFRPNGKAVAIFQAAGAAPKEFHTASVVKSVLTTYLEKESLINATNKRLANLNPELSSLPLLKDHTGATIDRSVLADKLLASCSQFYRVVNQSSPPSDQEAKPKPGPPPTISVVIETRQGKKSITRVSGLEPFGIDAKAAAEHLQKVCAGSASVSQLKGSSPKTPVMEIVLQGSQRKAVETYLKGCGVVGRYVNVVDKTGGKKK